MSSMLLYICANGRENILYQKTYFPGVNSCVVWHAIVSYYILYTLLNLWSMSCVHVSNLLALCHKHGFCDTADKINQTCCETESAMMIWRKDIYVFITPFAEKEYYRHVSARGQYFVERMPFSKLISIFRN